MTDKKVKTQVPVIFQKVEEFEKEDSRFIKIKIWLMHTGINFNGSAFSKESVNKAVPTLANTPILSFIEANAEGEKDFSDHRMELHRSEDGEYKFNYLGVAVGVIPETNNAHWEMRVTDSGEEKEYLVVDALMWTKWDDPTDIMATRGTTAQSMELADNYSGTIDNDGIFHFETFSFFGACLLGEGVQPAMENSTAELQFADNTKATQKTIENKLQEFYTLFSQQGGTGMTEVTKVETEVEAPEVFENTEEVNQVETQVEETEVVEVETAPEFQEESPVEVVEEQPEAVEEVETTEEFEVIDYEVKFNELNVEFAQLKDQLEELKSYKRSREEDDIKSQFTDKLSTEEIDEVFTVMKEASIEDVEVKLFALYGKKNFTSSKSQSQQTNKLSFSLPKDEDLVVSPYGDILDK